MLQRIAEHRHMGSIFQTVVIAEQQDSNADSVEQRGAHHIDHAAQEGVLRRDSQRGIRWLLQNGTNDDAEHTTDTQPQYKMIPLFCGHGKNHSAQQYKQIEMRIKKTHG